MDASHLRLAPAPAGQGDLRPPVDGSIRVVLADDHTQMRHSLRTLLDGEDDLEVVAEADDLNSVVSQVQGRRPPVLVFDLGMPNGSSGEAIQRLRARAPETQIVVVTMHESPVLAQGALAAGALGFVLKDFADEELPQAIRQAAKGQQYISPHIAKQLAILGRALVNDRLSAREVEVLRLVALGHTNVEIALKLRLSPRTIETHRARIQRKLGLTTRAELVRYALGHGLLRL